MNNTSIVLIFLAFSTSTSTYAFSEASENASNKITGKKRKQISAAATSLDEEAVASASNNEILDATQPLENDEAAIQQDRVAELVKKHGSKGAFLFNAASNKQDIVPNTFDTDLVLMSISDEDSIELNYEDPSTQKTPLMVATSNGSITLVEKFLAKKADPNHKNATKNVLQHALESNAWPQIVPTLLAWGANPARLTFTFSSQEDRAIFNAMVKKNEEEYHAPKAVILRHILIADVTSLVLNYLQVQPAPNYATNMNLYIKRSLQSGSSFYLRGGRRY